ncbi:Zn-ribbon domain-containing OB-fold protein [Rhodococcus sp. A5(2022)]|uniref:Zn-ribbon domain-containing OB-fold protein n=1 Tax=Rhodococcus sp. A5(2022) TaxID=3003588 RepID=UPI0022A8BB7B|nr:Zn-ribbon domain-containing OB-fold protein [Rhodococcus sp. A5(2022)]MCZ1075336.1 Zn-ribbon domain-containing OB-fold protein [Rhodococcus sp. A5(2022)]
MHSQDASFTPSSSLLTPYFDALDRHELTTTRCTCCGVGQFPPRTACSFCGTFDAFEWLTTAGKGTIWTFGVFHKMYFPNFGPDPYNVAVIELDEGTKLISNVVDVDNSELEIGMRVRAVFVDAGGHSAVRFELDPDAQTAHEKES